MPFPDRSRRLHLFLLGRVEKQSRNHTGGQLGGLVIGVQTHGHIVALTGDQRRGYVHVNRARTDVGLDIRAMANKLAFEMTEKNRFSITPI